MKFGPLPVAQALDAVLAHSLALPEGRMRKGHRLEAADLARLEAAGLDKVIAARLEPGDVDEDTAAARLAAALVPDPEAVGLRLGAPGTGRVNIHATGPGVLEVLAARIDALNAVDPMISVATVPQWQRCATRTMVATVKIIAYAVPGAALERACAEARGALRLHAPQRRRVALIRTRVAGAASEAEGPEAVRRRLERMGAVLISDTEVAHETDALARALAEVPGAELALILTGSATSDPHDVAPEALRRAGGQVTRFGMPVDPGNLLFFGDLGALPVIGLPGCARSPALNGADWVLERMLCAVPVTEGDVAAMGVGGLLKEIPTRPQPREGR
ncbi:molybdopterin-binding protein [Pseudooceanicola sp. CBS1P-1]|uniref:Molybdopterin biosynthesis protein n=1 Tax=Pseudooceanicola albus TaxID=2692189 RepID=A0A6L7FZ43_9RHOB|nr:MULTISPECIES: molybdopterin-binding protein [Pseudooceanicola]MBT9382474.1 molybdopterin-binding protein [Pseudooceanicola endophyticus]MXN17015.1 molybdopterin biosynthesis protein [Pseudooceanicola albus]